MASEKRSEDLKKQVEALLFAKGSRMHFDEIARLCRVSDLLRLKNSLSELQLDYDSMNSSLMVVNEGDFWKLTIREQHIPIVKKVVVDTELPKTVIETLAVIAYKAPAKQSEIIDIRTNKAYDHIKMLSELGYITSEKFGRTRLLKLSQRFFDYFDVPPDKIKEKFEKFKPVEGDIKDTEEEHLNKEIKFTELQKKQQSQDAEIESTIAALEALPAKSAEVPAVQEQKSVVVKEEPQPPAEK